MNTTGWLLEAQLMGKAEKIVLPWYLGVRKWNILKLISECYNKNEASSMMKLYKVQYAFETCLAHIVTTSVDCKQISLRERGGNIPK